MPDLPWRKFFPQHALSDPQLRRCSEATRGIWCFAFFTMMHQETCQLSGTIHELACDCVTNDALMQVAVDELKRTGTCNVEMQNGCIILTCRRLLREHNTKELKRKAANIRWSKTDAENKTCMHSAYAENEKAAYAPSASASASASVLSSLERGTGETQGASPTVTSNNASSIKPEPPPAYSSGQLTNHPPLQQVLDYWKAREKNGSDYTQDEVRHCYSQFMVTAEEGTGDWFWGKKKVTDWREAMESRMYENRKRQESMIPGFKPKHVKSAEALDAAVRNICGD
jgi:hypothetical protein